MLVNFVRNTNQFQKLSKAIKTFRTIDLYNEFNNLGEYFNNTLKIELENIVTKSLISVPDKFLINIGDGNTGWVDIIDVIEDNSIVLNKLQKIPSNSILGSDGDGNIIPIQCTIDYGILFGRYQDTHIWRKLVNEDIVDQSITGVQIDILEQLNLDDDITDNFITDNLLETKNIEDNSISSSKIINGTLDKDVFELPIGEIKTGLIPEKYVDDVGVDNLNAFRTDSRLITPSKIKDASITHTLYNDPKIFCLREYSDNPMYLHIEDTNNYFNGNTGEGYEYPVNYNLSVAEVIESYNILPESLEDEHLIPYQDIGDWNNIPWHDNYLEPRYFQQGYIAPRDDCRVEGRCIPLGQLRLRHFDDEVRNALIANGVTDDD